MGRRSKGKIARLTDSERAKKRERNLRRDRPVFKTITTQQGNKYKAPKESA